MHFMCQNRRLTGFGHDGLQKIAMGGGMWAMRRNTEAALKTRISVAPSILRHGGPGQT